MTRQRALILEILQHSPKHLTYSLLRIKVERT